MATWTQIWTLPRSVMSVQATTESPPSQATDGLYLDEVAGYRLTIIADSGQTITAAAGSFKAYVWDEWSGIWSRASDQDVVVTTDDIGGRGMATVFQVAAPLGRIAHVASGISVSGGGLTLYYITAYLSGKKG